MTNAQHTVQEIVNVSLEISSEEKNRVALANNSFVTCTSALIDNSNNANELSQCMRTLYFCSRLGI